MNIKCKISSGGLLQSSLIKWHALMIETTTIAPLSSSYSPHRLETLWKRLGLFTLRLVLLIKILMFEVAGILSLWLACQSGCMWGHGGLGQLNLGDQVVWTLFPLERDSNSHVALPDMNQSESILRS